MNNSIIKSWNNKQIRFREDGFGCLTDMAIATGKRVKDFLRLESTKKYLEVLSSCTGIPVHDNEDTESGSTEPAWLTDGTIPPSVNHAGSRALTEVIQGIGEEEGTWAHRRICIRFAQWCSPEFSVQVDGWIEELLLVGTVSIASQPTLEPIDIYNLDQETMDRLEAWWHYREYPSLEAVWEKYNHPDGTLEGFVSPDEADMLDDRLKVMPDEVIKYLCGLWILGNMQYSPEGMKKTRNALCNDRAALAAQQFQTQLDRTQLAAAPTQKQLG